MAGPLKPLPQYDYSGGANPVVAPSALGPKQSQRIVNFVLDEHGHLVTIPGTNTLYTAPVSEAGSRILLPIYWQPTAVTTSAQGLVVVGTTTTNELYNTATTPWTLLGTFNSNIFTPYAAILGNLLVITDGYSPPKQWDGAVFQNIINTVTVSPRGGRAILQHEGFLYLWNTQASSDLLFGGDGPSTLRQSNLNDPNAWNNAQVVFIDKDDGYQGQGFATFAVAETGIAPYDTVILFKDVATYQMTGNLGTGGGAPSTNFSLQRVKSDMGCYAPKSIQFCSGFGVIRLTHRGFALYDGVEDRLISEEIRPYLFGRDDIAAIDWTNVAYSWASQVPNPPLYVCFCPLFTTTLTRAFIYDLVRRSWTVADLPFGTASINLITPPGTLPLVLLGDSPAPGVVGRIRQWFGFSTTWDGTPITATMRSKLAFDGSPQEREYFRRLQMGTVADSSPVTLTTIVQCSNGITRQSQYILNASSLEYAVETGVDNACNSAYFDLTAVGKVRILGHEFHVRKKPLMGSSGMLGNRA